MSIIHQNPSTFSSIGQNVIYIVLLARDKFPTLTQVNNRSTWTINAHLNEDGNIQLFLKAL